MPFYTIDPKNPGQDIEVHDLLARDPETPPPPIEIVSFMRRTNWTRHEAHLILAGYSLSTTLDPAGIPVGPAYLDGTTWRTLQYKGVSPNGNYIPRDNPLTHPRQYDCISEYDELKYYDQGESLEERKTPQEWLIWADSIGFKPYWLDYWNSGQKLREWRAIEERQKNERCAAGRYTLKEAAETIAENTGERAQPLLKKLMQAVADGLLPVYGPSEKQTYGSTTVREFYEEVYWDDLNAWLDKYEPRISWRFPATDEAIAKPKEVPLVTTPKLEGNKAQPSPACEIFRKMGNLNPAEIKIEFVAGESGTCVLNISARSKSKRIALAELDLFDKRTADLNVQGILLLGMAQKRGSRKPELNTNKAAARISRLRKAIKTNLGLSLDPFAPYSESTGYEPLFHVSDKRSNADERAKRSARNVPLDTPEGARLVEKCQAEAHQELTPYEFDADEGDEAAQWLKDHDSKS